jgi:hypothetical protein
MNEYLREPQQEVHEEIIEENGPVAVDRREEVRVVRDADSEHREHIVHDIGEERRTILSRLTGFIWLLTGILEFAIALRILLKLIAANAATPFVNLVYSFTDLFLWPFAGLTATPQANGMVLELSSVVAMIVYAAIAWAIVRLIWLTATPSRSRRVSVERHEQF